MDNFTVTLSPNRKFHYQVEQHPHHVTGGCKYKIYQDGKFVASLEPVILQNASPQVKIAGTISKKFFERFHVCRFGSQPGELPLSCSFTIYFVRQTLKAPDQWIIVCFFVFLFFFGCLAVF